MSPELQAAATRRERHSVIEIMHFTAIDYDTANSSCGSACSVGMCKVKGGKLQLTNAFQKQYQMRISMNKNASMHLGTIDMFLCSVLPLLGPRREREKC